MSQSVAALDRGARKWFTETKELVAAQGNGAGTGGNDTASRKPLAKCNVTDVSRELEKRLSKSQPDTLTANERVTLQALLVQLIGIFAVDEDGSVDGPRLEELYNKAAA